MEMKLFVFVVCALLIVANASIFVQAKFKSIDPHCNTCDTNNQTFLNCNVDNYFDKSVNACKFNNNAKLKTDNTADKANIYRTFHQDRMEVTPKSCKDYPCIGCSSDEKRCIECAAGYRNYGYDCLKCNDTNCQTCNTDVNECSECLPHFGVLNKTCVKCKDQYCNICGDDASVCQMCIPNYGFSDAGYCEPCAIPSCEICSSSSKKCIRCFEDNYLEYGTCWPNQPQYCFEITPECTKCNDAKTNCTGCNYGYSIKDGKCVPCADKNCVMCFDDAKTCTHCGFKFQLDSAGVCKPEITTDHAVYSIAYFVTIALLLMTIVTVAQMA